MGTILASTIFTKVGLVLNDASKVRWTDAELIDWFNSGQRAIVVIKPDSCVKNVSVQLVAGTKQTLPTDGVRLNFVSRNMGSNGTTPGNAIQLVERDVLDSQLPGWHADTASATVQKYVFNKKDPKTWYCYPPQPATGMGYVEESYCCLPTDITADTDAMSLDDIYEGVLIDYILYRAFQKNSAVQGAAERSISHHNEFLAALGAKSKGDVITDPNNQPKMEPASTPETVA